LFLTLPCFKQPYRGAAALLILTILVEVAYETALPLSLKFLIDHGANVNAKDKYLQTPLSIASGDPQQLVHRAPNGLYDDHFRRPSAAIKSTVDLLLQSGASPITGPKADMSGL